ncbi:MAG: hypothetical protein HYY44_07615 [Deltaproteobacteria bacterium]|nr:hypothetical protein [Deltaproteobacteria bacterium]
MGSRSVPSTTVYVVGISGRGRYVSTVGEGVAQALRAALESQAPNVGDAGSIHTVGGSGSREVGIIRRLVDGKRFRLGQAVGLQHLHHRPGDAQIFKYATPFARIAAAVLIGASLTGLFLEEGVRP